MPLKFLVWIGTFCLKRKRVAIFVDYGMLYNCITVLMDCLFSCIKLRSIKFFTYFSFAKH